LCLVPIVLGVAKKDVADLWPAFCRIRGHVRRGSRSFSSVPLCRWWRCLLGFLASFVLLRVLMSSHLVVPRSGSRLLQELKEPINIPSPTFLRQRERLATGERCDGLWKIRAARQACPIDEDRNDWDVTLQRSGNLQVNPVIRIIQTAATLIVG